MNEDVENSRKLFIAINSIQQSSSELSLLWRNILDEFDSEKFQDGIKLEEVDIDDPAYDWISETSMIFGTARTSSRRKRFLGNVSVSFLLSGQCQYSQAGDPYPWGDKVCLIVGIWKGESDEYVWHEDFEDDTLYEFRHIGDGFWTYAEYALKEGGFFALPIFALKTDKDVKTMILEPLAVLAKCKDLETLDRKFLRGLPVLLPGD